MALRELLLQLGIEVDQQGVKKADSALDRIRKGAKAVIAAFGAGLAVRGIQNFIDAQVALGDQIGKTSAKLGVQTEELQKLQFAAQQTGVSQNTFNMALQRFTRRSAEAANGTGEAKDALAQLGIQLRDSQGNLRPTTELFDDVADAMQGVRDPNERLRLAFKLFDSEGAALVNTLAGGSAGLDEFRAEAERLGFVMSAELVAQSEAASDAQGRLGRAFQGIKNTIFAEVLPGFTESTDTMTEIAVLSRGPVLQGLRNLLEPFRSLGRILQEAGFSFIGVRDALGLGETKEGAENAKGLIVALKLLSALLLGIGTLAVATGLKVAGAWLLSTAPLIGFTLLIGLLADEMLAFADDSRDGFFEVLAKGFSDLIDETGSFGKAVEEVLVTAIDFWRKPINEFVEFFREELAALGKFLGVNPFATLTPGGRASGTPSVQASPSVAAASTAQGGTTVGGSNMSVEVNVDATNRQDAGQIGSSVGAEVEAVFSRASRSIARSVAVASGG